MTDIEFKGLRVGDHVFYEHVKYEVMNISRLSQKIYVNNKWVSKDSARVVKDEDKRTIVADFDGGSIEFQDIKDVIRYFGISRTSIRKNCNGESKHVSVKVQFNYKDEKIQNRRQG